MARKFLPMQCLYGYHLGGLEVGHHVRDANGQGGVVIGFTRNPRASNPADGIGVHIQPDADAYVDHNGRTYRVVAWSCHPSHVRIAD